MTTDQAQVAHQAQAEVWAQTVKQFGIKSAQAKAALAQLHDIKRWLPVTPGFLHMAGGHRRPR